MFLNGSHENGMFFYTIVEFEYAFVVCFGVFF